MRAVKFLEKPKVIRNFGIALLLAPFINIAMSMFLESWNKPMTFSIVVNSLMVGTFAQNAQNVLSITSIIIGIMMLQGRSNAWRYVLGFLGLHIIIQTTTLFRDVKQNWIWGGVFLVNLIVFFFIADQLVFKEKTDEPEEKKAPPVEVPSVDVPKVASFAEHAARKRNPTYTTKKRIVIRFAEMNMWGQLIHISQDGLLVRSFQDVKEQFSSKPIEVALTGDLSLGLKLKRQKNPEFFFEFVDLTQTEVKKLNEWILSKAA